MNRPSADEFYKSTRTLAAEIQDAFSGHARKIVAKSAGTEPTAAMREVFADPVAKLAWEVAATSAAQKDSYTAFAELARLGLTASEIIDVRNFIRRGA